MTEQVRRIQSKEGIFCEADIVCRRIVGYRVYRNSYNKPITRQYKTEQAAWAAAERYFRRRGRTRIILSAVLLAAVVGVALWVSGCDSHRTISANEMRRAA